MNIANYANAYPSLQFEDMNNCILEIRLIREHRLNAADANMHRELANVWRDVDADEDVSAVLVSGNEKAFSSGGDFELIESMIVDDTTLARVWKEARDLVYNIVNCSRPIVSAIRGPAVGAGLAVALLADIFVAGKSAKIFDGHVKLGVAAGDHAAMICPLLCGMAKSKYYLLTNSPLDGTEAERIGLVSMVTDDADVEVSALEIARELALSCPSAVRWAKYALNNWLRSAGPIFDTSLALEFMGFRQPDAKEGLNAIKEKRPPEFGRKSPL